MKMTLSSVQIWYGRRVLILNLSNRHDYNAAGSSQKCEMSTREFSHVA